jgi:dihydroorotate dehydrogenase
MTQPMPPSLPLTDFAEITQLIVAARLRAVQAVNTTLIDLYWQVGVSNAQVL